MKPFTWSYSRLKNFENCALKAHECDDLKHFQDGGEEMLWGNQVHGALAGAVSGKDHIAIARKGMEPYKKWAGGVRLLAKQLDGDLQVEQKYAITRGLVACPYFDKDKNNPLAWYRGIADVAILYPRVGPTRALALDYKTGKVFHDGVQLFLMAACIFATYPTIEEIDTRFIWLKYPDAAPSEDNFKRSQLRDMWAPVLDRVARMEDAYIKNYFPPTPSGLCRKHCPVTTCEFNGQYHNAGR